MLSPMPRMRLHPKLESNEVLRLTSKGEREPFPKQRRGQMSPKYTLSWTDVPKVHTVHVCAYEGRGQGGVACWQRNT